MNMLPALAFPKHVRLFFLSPRSNSTPLPYVPGRQVLPFGHSTCALPLQRITGMNTRLSICMT